MIGLLYFVVTLTARPRRTVAMRTGRQGRKDLMLVVWTARVHLCDPPGAQADQGDAMRTVDRNKEPASRPKIRRPP